MSYAIANVIYGVPLNEEANDLINKWEQDETNDNWFEDNDGTCGFTMLYTGSADYAGYCGVSLMEFDECEDFRPISSLNVQPTEKQIEEVKAKVAKLHPELKAVLPEIGTYLVWSTS